MIEVGRFEKVTFEQYKEAMSGVFGEEYTAEPLEVVYERISLPRRATSGSAGYDFKAPFSFELSPGESIKVPTGVRVKIDEGWVLACVPRSSLGFKYRCQLDNSIGIVDGDYYFSDNEGHIFVKLTNDSKSGQRMQIKAGNAMFQGIFLQYGITYDDDTKEIRNGGFGSTDPDNKRVSEQLYDRIE